jgi:ABC-type transporter Mla subunit MlaD
MAREDSMVHHARQRKRTWYGSAIIVLLTALALFIFFLDDIVARFERRYAIVILMQRSPVGLGAGSPVWIGGKEVGTVTAVGFLPSGPDTLAHVAVTVDLPRAVRHQVRADSHVRLTSDRMIGEPALDLVPGTPVAPIVLPGDTLRVVQRKSFADLSRDAAAVRAQLDTTIRALHQLMPQLRSRARQARRAFAAFHAVMTGARDLRRAVFASPTMSLLGDAALGGSRAHAAELARLLRVWQRTATGGELRAAADRLELHAAALRAQLDDMAASLQAGNGSLGRAQRDAPLRRALDATRVELDSLIAETKRNPLRFMF